jgi:hypothetical protein
MGKREKVLIDGKSVARLRDKYLLYRNPKKAVIDCISVAVACRTWDMEFLAVLNITRELKSRVKNRTKAPGFLGVQTVPNLVIILSLVCEVV